LAPTPSLGLRRRVLFLFFIALFCCGGLVGRLAYIQFFWGEELRAEAVDQRMRELRIPAKRGIIYDTRGRELAISMNVDTVFAAPPEIENPQETARLLAQTLGLDEQKVLAKIQEPVAFVYVKRQIDEEASHRLRDLNLPGIYLTQDSKRYYPKGKLAAHVLGIAGVDNQGLEGIEYVYDQELRGEQGYILLEFDNRGHEIPHAEHSYVAPQDGLDLVLTIDETIQFITERELDAAMQRTQAKKGVAIVMEPKTGRILAMAVRPTFDPNNYNDFPAQNRRNTAIADVYHPGSTFKPLTAAAALEEGTSHLSDTFYCKGGTEVSGWSIGCIRAHESLTFVEALEKSCNMALIQIGLDLGIEKFYHYVEAFGLRERTGIDLPGEAKGIVKPLANMTKLDLAVMSFGQTLAISPLRLLTDTAALANDGVLMQPYIAQRFLDGDGNVVKEFRPQEVRRVVSVQTAREIQLAMEGVVAHGTGQANAQVPGYRVAGKTGTAEKIQGRDGLYVAWFTGFAPVEAPRLAMVVMLDEPVGQYYGGTVAAPVFAAVMRDSLRYLEVPPSQREGEPGTKPDEEELREVPDVVGLPPGEARQMLSAAGLRMRLEGTGTVVGEQVPAAQALVQPGLTVLVRLTEPPDAAETTASVSVPNLAGLTMREAAEQLYAKGLLLDPVGSGQVVGQEPGAGQSVPPGTTITIFLEPPLPENAA